MDTILRFDQSLHAGQSNNSPDTDIQSKQLVKQSIQRITFTNLEGFTKKVAIALVIRFGQHSMELDDIARDLEMASELIKYLLKQEGENFIQLRMKVRQDLAITHLIEGTTIDDIACHLGFAERKTFTQAFKRWTGLTPNAFRKYYQRHMGD